MQTIMEIDFRGIDAVVLLHDEDEIDIDESQLWFPEVSMGLKNIGGKLSFDVAGEGMRTIAIIDVEENRRMRLEVSTFLSANRRYAISAKGLHV